MNQSSPSTRNYNKLEAKMTKLDDNTNTRRTVSEKMQTKSPSHLFTEYSEFADDFFADLDHIEKKQYHNLASQFSQLHHKNRAFLPGQDNSDDQIPDCSATSTHSITNVISKLHNPYTEYSAFSWIIPPAYDTHRLLKLPSAANSIQIKYNFEPKDKTPKNTMPTNNALHWATTKNRNDRPSHVYGLLPAINYELPHTTTTNYELPNAETTESLPKTTSFRMIQL
jgi:hypothetical protein